MTDPFVLEALAELERSDRLRNVRAVVTDGAAHVRIDGRRVACFASNDYLGLSNDLSVRHAIADAALEHGLGPRGSALICGHTEHHAALEEELAALTQKPAAVLTPTGYAANLAVLDTLADGDLHVFSDELNHASIVDACHRAKRKGAQVDVYKHADMNDLEHRLNTSTQRRKLVFTETVFSMDGDLAPLNDLDTLRTRHGFLLAVDEGHGTLVFGATGAGVAEHLGVRVDIHVGTASKAIAAVGGFIACDESTARLIRNRARTYVFSTALPIPCVAAIRAALRAATPAMRERLWCNTRRFRTDATSPILPIVLGDERAALTVGGDLLRSGFLVATVRPPTVPVGTSRLRITMSAAHDLDTIDRLAACVSF